MKRILKSAYWFVFLAIVIIAFSVTTSAFNTPLKFRLFAVQSGSMEPNVPLGSLVAVRSADSYMENDVITVRAERNPKETFTHRIVEISEDKDLDRVSYKTKGDANEDADGELVNENRVIGKVILTVPYLGYPVGFAQTQIGFIVLIIIPATVIIYSELANMKGEFAKIFSKNKKNKKKRQKKGKNDAR